MTVREVKKELNVIEDKVIHEAIDFGVLQASKKSAKRYDGKGKSFWDITSESVEAVKKRRNRLESEFTMRDVQEICGFTGKMYKNVKKLRRLVKAELVKDTLLQICPSYRIKPEKVEEVILTYFSGDAQVKALNNLKTALSEAGRHRRIARLKTKVWYRRWKGLL